MRTASRGRRDPADASTAAAGGGRSQGAPHPRRLVYLETLDPLYDQDGGAARMLYRIRRDFPWALGHDWELERWGVWRAGQATEGRRAGGSRRQATEGRRAGWVHDGQPPPGAGTVRGPRVPAWVPTHPALAALAWTVHLALALRRPRSGVVVAYNPFTALGVALAGLLRRSPPLVVRVIGNISSKALVVHGSRRRARLLAAVEGFALRRADLVVPMGPFTRDLARRAGARDDRIVELPHPPRWFGTQANGGGEAGGRVRIVAAGRFVTSKGFDVLLRAFALLAGEIDDVVLEIAGDGPERDRLERLAAELGVKRRVSFRGWLPADRMPDFFAGALVSVLPSRVEEGLGMVLVEAGMAGCALVGSDLGGIRDIVRPLETGLLVPTEDPTELAEALRRLLADRDEARRLGDGARTAALAYVGDRETALRELRQRLDELQPDPFGQQVAR